MLAPAPWPVSQDVAALADRASALSRAAAGPRNPLGALAAALHRIQPVARELERWRWLTPGDPEVPDLHAWLFELRNAVADAEDILDELHSRRQVGPPLSACVYATFRGPGRKLRRLAERLDRARDDSERLRPGRASAAAGCGVRSPNRVTGSVLAERKVFGRGEECDSIVARLVDDCEETCRSVAPVVAVVGHGGVGKTTVAQCVYNDARIEARFGMRAWVCVWDRSDEVELTREILQSIGCADDAPCDDGLSSLDSLQEELEKLVASKRFLLVLDDVWIDEGKTEKENRSMWKKVLAPLRSAAIGSKVLVTTRMKLVAEVLNAAHVVSLDRLRSSDCWLLLKEVALGGQPMDFPPELQEILGAIVANVKGLPLATKAIGQMISSTRSTRKWRALMNTEISDNIIISSLQLSYQQLPGHLQRCFAYCSIFPTTWRFNRYDLVKMWMALGFIQPPTDEGKGMEDLGQKYFDDLLSRSFFGTANKDQQTYYFLDDLMHSLAQHFSAHDCMKINEDVPVVIPPTVRHLSISTDYLPQLKSKYRLGRLRTLLVLRSPSLSSSHFPRKLLAKFKNLRVLDLSESDIAELPETISQLVHLHYLAFSGIANKLPKSIYRLKQLEAELSCTQLQPSVASEHRTGFSRLRPIALRRASARKPHNLSLAGSGAAVPRPHRDFSFGPRSGSPARHRAGWSVHRGRSFRRLPPPAPVNRARSQSSYALEAPTIFCPVLPCGFSTAAPDTTAAKEGRERRGRNQLACAGARTRSGAAEPEPQTPGEVLAIEVCPMDRGGSQKKRHKSVANVDIISNLPDVIKDKILCYLPIKEAIRTCLLSRKWRYTWASMTELMFREDDFALGNGNEDGDSVRFASFVHTFLSLHYGPILKFEMNARRVHTFSPGGHIHRWMLILSRNGIKEIQIKTRIWRNYKIPSSFFSCAELEYACLQGCIFQLPSLFTGFKRMHTLHFIEFCATENNIGELVANCPNLEELILSRLLSFADITIHSTKLKVLRVDGMFKHLNLVTPHVSSAVINLRVNTGYVPRAGSNFNLSQFIGSLLDIENISLLGHAFECAAHGILPGKLSRLLNRLTEITLELDLGNLKEANAAHCLFQIAPNLRRMELQLMHRGYSAPTSNFWDSIDHQDCLFKNLYTVVMNNFTGSCAESGFLELLLKDATVLRSARIKDNNKLDKESLKRILKMRRASKDAEIILL